MTSEQQLDEALKFLLKWNKSGSYLYYKDDDVKKQFDDNRDRLEKHFKNIGIEEPYRSPIIIHLMNARLINYFYSELKDRENALLPHQIKIDRKSTRLNSSHTVISYAVFCLKKKIKKPLNNSSNLETIC